MNGGMIPTTSTGLPESSSGEQLGRPNEHAVLKRRLIS